MKKYKLRNRLLLINICIIGLVFLFQFIFQNIFFDYYYEQYQKKILTNKIKQCEKAYIDGTLNKDIISELTNNNKMLLAIIDKDGYSIEGNVFEEDLVTIKTDENETLDVYSLTPFSVNKIEIGSKIKGSIYKIKGTDKYYFKYIEIDNNIIYDIIESGFTSEGKIQENYYEIKETDYREIQGKIIKYTSNNKVGIDHQVNVSNYIYNNELFNTTKLIKSPTNNYLLKIKKIDDGYIIASTSLEQSKEIIIILNNFNKYIVLFTIILIILVIYNFSQTIINPIMKMKECAKAIANQDFSYNIELKSKDELQELAEALNSISNNLENKINNLEKMNNKLKIEYEERLEIEKSQKKLLMNISHDLKTPLTIIKGYLKAIKDGVYKKEEYIDLTIESVDEISNTLSDMLELTKFRNKSIDLSLDKMDLTRTIYKTFNDFVQLSKQKELEVHLDLLDDVFITADKNSIIKVFQNLISNAIKYSPKHNKIFIKLTQQDKGYKFTIENTGVHIPESDLEYVYDEFYRVDKSRNESIKGNGLGLGIVKIILEKHRLEYCINNTHEGVMFTIIFR